MKDEVFVLEDNKKYYPLKTKIINGIKYFMLVNIDDVNDVCVRKELVENNQEFISMLETEDELKMVLDELQND